MDTNLLPESVTKLHDILRPRHKDVRESGELLQIYCALKDKRNVNIVPLVTRGIAKQYLPQIRIL